MRGAMQVRKRRTLQRLHLFFCQLLMIQPQLCSLSRRSGYKQTPSFGSSCVSEQVLFSMSLIDFKSLLDRSGRKTACTNFLHFTLGEMSRQYSILILDLSCSGIESVRVGFSFSTSGKTTLWWEGGPEGRDAPQRHDYMQKRLSGCRCRHAINAAFVPKQL